MPGFTHRLPVQGRPSRLLSRHREEGTTLFEFVCEKLIPGCGHKDHDEKEERLLERAAEHLRVHHTVDHFEEPVDETLRSVGIQFIRPA